MISSMRFWVSSSLTYPSSSGTIWLKRTRARGGFDQLAVDADRDRGVKADLAVVVGDEHFIWIREKLSFAGIALLRPWSGSSSRARCPGSGWREAVRSPGDRML